MPKIVTVEQIRAIEQAADKRGHSYADMMEQAGRAVAERVKEIVLGIAAPRIAILVGPGNNGGDGLVAGRVLAEELEGASVGAFLLQPRGDDDAVFVKAREAGVFLADAENDQGQGYRVLQNLIANADVVIDALFGTSLRLPIKGDAAKVLEAVHKALGKRRDGQNMRLTTPASPGIVLDTGPRIIAVDCPSGLDCDSGALDKNAIYADETITMAAVKPGLLLFPGADAVGVLHVADIGLPKRLAELDGVKLILADVHEVAARLPQRQRDSHKGTFGKALIVAGSMNYIGAVALCANAAYRSGAGLVTVAAPQIIVPMLASMVAEATWVLLPHEMGVVNESAVKVLREEMDGYSALLIGPGLGREDVSGEFMLELLQPKAEIRRARAIGFVPLTPGDTAAQANIALPPLVIDADGLNLLAGIENWPELLPPGTILTPHPGEFARLTGLDVADIQADRVRLAQEKAAEWGCVVVLKGAFTVVAAPDGLTAVMPFATTALAHAGTGDVLAGAIVGLRAQGLEPFDAAVVGAWLQGMAGVRAEAVLGTAAGVTAGDVLELLPDAYALAESARR
jgi:NAD(P)H-hydrate epimerase